MDTGDAVANTGGHRISSPNDDTTSFPPGEAAAGFFGWSATCSLQIDNLLR
jgi:hypothetical protein